MNMKENTVRIGNMEVKIVAKDDEASVREIIGERDAEMDRRATAAVNSAIQKAKVCQKPIGKYDAKSGRAYMEYADGRKEYVN